VSLLDTLFFFQHPSPSSSQFFDTIWQPTFHQAFVPTFFFETDFCLRRRLAVFPFSPPFFPPFLTFIEGDELPFDDLSLLLLTTLRTDYCVTPMLATDQVRSCQCFVATAGDYDIGLPCLCRITTPEVTSGPQTFFFSFLHTYITLSLWRPRPVHILFWSTVPADRFCSTLLLFVFVLPPLIRLLFPFLLNYCLLRFAPKRLCLPFYTSPSPEPV